MTRQMGQTFIRNLSDSFWPVEYSGPYSVLVKFFGCYLLVVAHDIRLRAIRVPYYDEAEKLNNEVTGKRVYRSPHKSPT